MLIHEYNVNQKHFMNNKLTSSVTVTSLDKWKGGGEGMWKFKETSHIRINRKIKIARWWNFQIIEQSDFSFHFVYSNKDK